MDIDNVHHKALRRFLETGNAKGVIEPERIADMIAFIDAAERFEELSIPPNFGFHPLTGNRKGVFAMTVTRNWRLTFTKVDDGAIGSLDLEDYH